MSRRSAREAVFKLVFEYLFYGEKNETTLEILKTDGSLTADDKAYIDRIYNGVTDNFSELKSMVAKYAVGYDADRIYKPDLTALVIADYELKYETEIPPAVVASSAVELVKRYSDEKSFSFVNGILSTLIKETNRG